MGLPTRVAWFGSFFYHRAHHWFATFGLRNFPHSRTSHTFATFSAVLARICTIPRVYTRTSGLRVAGGYTSRLPRGFRARSRLFPDRSNTVAWFGLRVHTRGSDRFT